MAIIFKNRNNNRNNNRNKKNLYPIYILLIIIILALYYYENIYKADKNTEYDREDWGNWIDEDNDGLNTRHEVLAEESLIKPVISNGKVIKGKWFDKYTGKYFTNPNDLDIDHLVPLKNAHISGASNWSKRKKNRYYNYLKYENHLIAVSKSANRSKSDKSPTEWLPPNEEYQCEYVREWFKIKKSWGLELEEGFDEISNRVCKGK